MEMELKREREERVAGSNVDQLKLEHHQKQLQRHQASLRALSRCCDRSRHSAAVLMRHLLDGEAENIRRWVVANFLLKENASDINEEKVAELVAQQTNRSGEELRMLQTEFANFIRENKAQLEVLRSSMDAREARSATVDAGAGSASGISDAYIRRIVREALKLYDADKTGKVDFALETAGGQVQSVRCTETYVATSKSYFLLGWPIFTASTSPRDAISPSMAPGQCWAFVGSLGNLVLQLSHNITVTGFTMEHISRQLAPSGHIESAPKNFSMWGLNEENDLEPHHFGDYEYLDNDETLQHFPVLLPAAHAYKFVELKITSNHGNPTYTCLYRIRVHGKVYQSYL